MKKIKRIISYTTRPKRSNEIDGVDYIYIDNDQFLEMQKQGMFYETNAYEVEKGKTWHYALSKLNMSDNAHNIAVITPHGVEQLATYNNGQLKKQLIVIQLLTPIATRIDRYLKRENGDCKEKFLKQRLTQDELDFKNFDSIINKFDLEEQHYHLLNDKTTDIETIKDLILTIISQFDENKIICLVGETCTGKTTLELELTK